MQNMLIINADDFGLNKNTNTAIIYCFEKKFCSSTTIMPNMPGFEDACRAAHERKLLNHIGLHLALTQGNPLTEAMKRQGRFCDKAGQFIMDRTRRIFRLTAKERAILTAEIKAQITRCRDFGLPLTHIDSHHHIHEEPAVATVLIKVMKEFKIPYLRIMNNIVPARTFIRQMYTVNFNSRLKWRHLARTEYFGDISSYLKFKENEAAFKKAKSVEIMVHPVLSGENTVIEASTKEPMENLIKQVDLHEKAQSFNGRKYELSSM
jgi:predicted glycoside hydrolase/deacetylase ChbG (UPF0249 family)